MCAVKPPDTRDSQLLDSATPEQAAAQIPRRATPAPARAYILGSTGKNAGARQLGSPLVLPQEAILPDRLLSFFLFSSFYGLPGAKRPASLAFSFSAT